MFPDARAPDLFVLLHGMLFTNIQLDDFQPTLARFIERLEIEDAEEREWAMMAVVNISAMLEYGKPSGVLRKRGGVGARDLAAISTGMRVMTKRGALEEEKMDIDEQQHGRSPDLKATITAIQTSPTLALAEATTEPPASFKLALQLTFAMLTHVLRNPQRKASPYARSTLNPYLTLLLTFLATVLRHPATLELLERSVPWEELARFFARVPRDVMVEQLTLAQPQGQVPGERWTMLTSGCAPPLSEDWCLRGMEWVGRRVYERGFWKVAEDRRMELEFLDKSEAGEVSDGIIEDGHGDEDGSKRVPDEGVRRWVRIFRSAVGIASVVDGFTWVEETGEWRIEGMLEQKAKQWREEDRLEREAEERRRMGRRWSDDSMDVDDVECMDDDSSESEDDEDVSDDIKSLKVCCYLQSSSNKFTNLIH
jgi:protein SMG6